MPKIVDPDQLNRGTEIILDFSNPSARTIRLVQAGNLDADGVTLQCIYSKLKDLWRSAADLPKIPFPMTAITEEKFDLINGWDWFNDASRYLLRDAGWAVRDSSNALLQMWANVTTLGSLGTSDQVYFQQIPNGAATSFQRTGAVNQAVQVLKAGAGAFDYRGFLPLKVREQGKTYGAASLTDIGIVQLDYRKNSFPLTNAIDPKVSTSDATISGSAPYTGMSITYLAGVGFMAWASGQSYAVNTVVSFSGRWYRATSAHSSTTNNEPTDSGAPWVAYEGERQIGANYYPYTIVVNGNNGTAEQIYEFVQYQLRQNGDIDAGPGTVTGKTAATLLAFGVAPGIGEALITSNGVKIDNFNNSDINRIVFTDVGGTGRTFPFTAAGNLQFSPTLSTDPTAKFWLYFSNPSAAANDEFGTSGAILVNDSNGNPIAGNVPQQPNGSTASFSFSYDSNVQGGRTAGTDAAVVAVAIGTAGAQYVSATGTITRSTGNTIALTAGLERVYLNP